MILKNFLKNRMGGYGLGINCVRMGKSGEKVNQVKKSTMYTTSNNVHYMQQCILMQQCTLIQQCTLKQQCTQHATMYTTWNNVH